MGGTLARYSAEGVRTTVITCTSGDLGEVRAADAPIRDGVGCVRARELHAAAQRLGVSRVVMFGYGDSGMTISPWSFRAGAFFGADLAEAAARVVEVIREERPQVLVAYDQTGGYGHPDHLKAHQVACAAFEASGPDRPARLYFVRFPVTWSRNFVHALRQAGLDAPGSAPSGADAGQDVHEIGVPDDLVTTAIEVREYIPTKWAALAAHASQMPPDHWFMRMPPDLAERYWAFEFFSREHGSAPASPTSGRFESDLFAGLE
jgi:LmbE family N-acetylglucosaminyl deacetylase